MDPHVTDHTGVDSGSALANFAKQHFGVELLKDASSEDDNTKPIWKGNYKSSGKGFVYLNLSMIVMV